MAEKRAKSQITAVLIGKLFQHFGPALGIRAVIFCDNLHRAAIDATALVDQIHRRLRRAIIPTAIG